MWPNWTNRSNVMVCLLLVSISSVIVGNVCSVWLPSSFARTCSCFTWIWYQRFVWRDDPPTVRPAWFLRLFRSWLQDAIPTIKHRYSLHLPDCGVSHRVGSVWPQVVCFAGRGQSTWMGWFESNRLISLTCKWRILLPHTRSYSSDWRNAFVTCDRCKTHLEWLKNFKVSCSMTGLGLFVVFLFFCHSRFLVA